MELKPGYKQTEVGMIPEDWSLRPLGSIGKWLSGSTPSMSIAAYWSGSIPWISPKDMKVSRLHDSIDHITPKAVAEGARLLPAGAVLVVIRGMILVHSFPVARAERTLGFNQDIKAVVTGDSVDSHFLLYWLTANTQKLRGLATESTHGTKRLPTEMLFRELVACPPMAEQEAIAEALSDADTLIESLGQLLAKKCQIKQGAMQKLLTGKTRLLGFSADWRAKRLGEIANIQRGASPRPIDSPIWFDEKSSVGWVRISDVTKSGMYLRETAQRLSTLGIRHSRPIPRGSLIMSICATVGRPVITEIDTCIHDGFVVFDNLQADKNFLYYMLSSIEGDWSQHGQTGSQMNLNTGLIDRTEIYIPSTTEEQIAIAAILSDMDAEIAALEAKLTKTRQIKQGMMQELLTGRIRLV